MSGANLVLLRTVHSSFHARVIAARLGADGIVTQLQGNVDGPYPIGDVSVWVTEDDAPSARELLLADEVEAVFDLPEDGDLPRPVLLGLSRMQLLAGAGIVILLWAAISRVIA